MKSLIPGTKFLCIGSAGSGKTYSTRTWFDTPVQPVHLFIEPSMTTIGDIKAAKWKYISPMPKEVTWDSLTSIAKYSNTLGHEALQKSGVNERSKFTQFIEVIATLNHFVTDQGEDLGDVADWGTDKVLIIDGLTGLTQLARFLRSGLTPQPPQNDYGVIQSNLYSLISFLVYNLQCHLVLIGHIDKEQDMITGGFVKTVHTIGRKLAPTIPPLFDDVVIAEKIGTEFTWTTVEPNADTKNRNLPLEAKMKQDFGILLKAWEGNGGVVGGTVKNVADNA